VNQARGDSWRGGVRRVVARLMVRAPDEVDRQRSIQRHCQPEHSEFKAISSLHPDRRFEPDTASERAQRTDEVPRPQQRRPHQRPRQDPVQGKHE